MIVGFRAQIVLIERLLSVRNISAKLVDVRFFYVSNSVLVKIFISSSFEDKRLLNSVVLGISLILGWINGMSHHVDAMATIENVETWVMLFWKCLSKSLLYQKANLNYYQELS